MVFAYSGHRGIVLSTVLVFTYWLGGSPSQDDIYTAGGPRHLVTNLHGQEESQSQSQKHTRARREALIDILLSATVQHNPPSATIPHSFLFIPAFFPVSPIMPHHGSGPIVLPPLPHALGVIPSFCVNGQKTLVMKEKVWTLTQDSFHIHDENNVEVLQCKAKLFSLHHQKYFYDMQGNELWSLKHKPLSIPRQYYGEGPDGREVFHVQGHWHCLCPFLFSPVPPLCDELSLFIL